MMFDYSMLTYIDFNYNDKRLVTGSMNKLVLKQNFEITLLGLGC